MVAAKPSKNKKKKELVKIKLQVKAQEANPAPPIGPALGQHGVNIMEFCKAFNAETQKVDKGTVLPVVLTVYGDRSFSFILKTPPVTGLLLKAAGIEKGGKSRLDKAGKVTLAQIEEIAKTKMPDLTASDLKAAMRIIIGSAHSMRIEVEGGENV